MTFWLYRRGKFYSLRSIWYEAKYNKKNRNNGSN